MDNTRKSINRRLFMKTTALAGTALILPLEVLSSAIRKETIAFGLIADVHKDVMHDAEERLQEFIDVASEKDLDFIMQLGDFCRPYGYNEGFLNIFNGYNGDKYHVLGNHDMDGGFSRDQTRAFWNMPKNYYSFDKKGIHFIVLDGNDPNPSPWSGYNRYIGDAQKEWLIKDLEQTNNPTIIFSHQSLELEYDGIANMKEIRGILERANRTAGFKKVLCCINGHTHTDYATQINDIYYVQINSASYRWVGGDHKVVRYSKEIDEKFEWIKYTIPYRDPLYTFVKIKHNKIIIEPKITEFVGPGPREMNLPESLPNDPIVPSISKYELEI